MKIDFEYGQGLMTAELPEGTDIFVPGETVADPPHIAEGELIEKTRASIRQPVGMEPIGRQVKNGSRVVIVFPDRVKGGFQAGSHRKTAIPILIDECLQAGVKKRDITLICSNGLHRKNTPAELREILGDAIFDEFYTAGQIRNHDSEDWDDLIDLGHTDAGDPVIMNKTVYEADLAIIVGHTLGNPYGGYSGGYKHSSTGITHWRSIASHHNPRVMHAPDFTPVNSHSTMRRKFDEISLHMEERMGKKFFTCDAVLDTKMRQIAVFSGYAKDIQPMSWKVADKRTYVPWAQRKYDVMVFGMPQAFHYGNGHGTNPILMLQAISANVIRHKRVLNDNCVVICASICNGYFHDQEFTGYRELYNLYQEDYHYQLPDLEKYGEYFATNEEFIRRYRFKFGYHPFHCFSMISCGHVAHMHCGAIYIAGAYEPGYARGMGMKTSATIEEALNDARRYVGPDPAILALPRTFKTAGVHLQLQ